jgi:hypothetical protein
MVHAGSNLYHTLGLTKKRVLNKRGSQSTDIPVCFTRVD